MRYFMLMLLLLPLVGCGESQQPEQQQGAGQEQAAGSKQEQNAEQATGSEPGVVGEESANFIEVVANGTGLTPPTALLDAFRNATQQVVGVYADVETLVKNNKLIEEKVLTYSDGFVKKYEKISQQTEGGLVRVKIRASVERRSVIAKLRAANITVKKLDGQGLFAEAVTQLEAEQGAADLLRKALEGFPQSLLTANVIGRPELVEKSNDKATVRIQVRVEPDLEAYKTFVARLQPMLEKVAKDRGEFTAVFESEKGRPFRNGEERNYFNPKESGFATLMAGWMPKSFSGGSKHFPRLTSKYTTLALTSQRSMSSDRLECRYYLMDKSLQPLLAEVGFRKGSGKLSLLDADGDVVVVDRFSLYESVPRSTVSFEGTLMVLAGHYLFDPVNFYMLGRDEDRRKEAFLFWISPVFMQSSTNHVHYTPSLQLARTISLSLDELKLVQTAKCEIIFRE